MAGAWRGASIRVEGLKETQRAFRRIGGDLPKATRRALREIAKPVQSMARANIEHRTGRHGAASPLGPSIRIGVNQSSLSVYSNALHAHVQDEGGHVGHGALITRASASHYMTRAVQESQPAVITALEHLGDTIEREFVE